MPMHITKTEQERVLTMPRKYLQICLLRCKAGKQRNMGNHWAKRWRQDAICSDVAIVLTPDPTECHTWSLTKTLEFGTQMSSGYLSVQAGSKFEMQLFTLHHLDQSVCPVSIIFTTCNSYTWHTSFDIIIVQVYMFHCSNHNKIQQTWMTRRNGLKNASFKLSFFISQKKTVPTIDWAVLVVRRPSFFEYFDWRIEKFLVSIQPNPHGHPRPNCVSSVTSGHWRAQQLANLKASCYTANKTMANTADGCLTVWYLKQMFVPH